MHNQANNIINQIDNKVISLKNIGADKILNNTLDKLINIQLAKYQKYLNEIKQSLSDFEKKYSMQSSMFYSLYNEGKMGDEMDYIEWSSLYESYEYYNSQIKKLKIVS